MKSSMLSSSPPASLLQVLLWYLALGAIHECFHLLTALMLCGDGEDDGHVVGSGGDKFVSFLFGLTLGRHVEMSLFDDTTIKNDENKEIEEIVRHAGWIGSVVVALFLLWYFPPRTTETETKSKAHHVLPSVAILVALEAISTDLLQLEGLLLPIYSSGTPSSSTLSFHCGNFGIVLLHHLWWTQSEKRDEALDVLQTMIRVTMMRGAQCGGVVCYTPTQGAIVSRVVNRKRTDLSESVRQKVDSDVFGHSRRFFVSPRRLVKRNPFTRDNTRAVAMSGHTRFATSSKATMDGCHPQIWTPASKRRLVHLNDGSTQTKMVENYITHNGDFDFYSLSNGKTYDLSVIQKWLVSVTHTPLASTVDSLAVAGMIDLLRTKGCFGLSCRYAICLGLPTSTITEDLDGKFPLYTHFETIGNCFEQVLQEMLKTTTMEAIETSPVVRNSFALRVTTKLQPQRQALFQQQQLENYLTDDEGDASLQAFCLATINAFFDNDLFWTLSTFLENAKGSFGLCITSSLDAHRQLCLAARGQTMSIAFYPNKGLICYGSEQAAVKAGLNAKAFSSNNDDVSGQSRGDLDDDALRLDLDDLGGEIAVLDWSDPKSTPHVTSVPHRNKPVHEMMNGKVRLVLHQESKSTPLAHDVIFHRMTKLTRNTLVKPLRPETDDLILSDIQDIPKVCANIQDEFHVSKAATSLNRLTAYNLSRCLRDRLDMHLEDRAPILGIDILLTGCEVSLWIAEQFACDLQTAFPRLRIKCVSANKLLGLFGQEIPLPALGHPYSSRTYSLQDAIVIIVSHSGGTFGPLACSNLLQAATKNIFVVTSEWDTQVGKQLRAMDRDNDEEDHGLFSSRIFSTEVGLRSAEPCSVSVAATHQLLTNLFLYVSAVIISDVRYKRITESIISENDLQVLQRLNIMNIESLSEIVGVNSMGHVFDRETDTLKELRAAGNLWANHVLENARAYIMTFIYIVVTVTIGYPLVTGIVTAAGVEVDWVFYITRFIDSLIYFWLPQINITLIRLWQNRAIKHRMVGRTVVIGDIPWVAQCAEAFLSKIFAVSYSISGVNVHSGNPADHLVHRFTHRVCRGSLLICGRPDGRLSALSTAEAAVCLSVNQASSIQSWGGTCESITIGHNPFKLPLSERAIILKPKRPLFLCERILVENDAKEEVKTEIDTHSAGPSQNRRSLLRSVSSRMTDVFSGSKRGSTSLDRSLSRSLNLFDSSVQLRVNKRRSAAALLGAYVNIQEEGQEKNPSSPNQETVSVDEILVDAIQEKKWSEKARALFNALDTDKDGVLTETEFLVNCSKVSKDLTKDEAKRCFFAADDDRTGTLDYNQFVRLLKESDLEAKLKAPVLTRDSRGVVAITPSSEKYFGEEIRRMNAGKEASNDTLDFRLAKMQHFSQELYETRIASLQRFVSMCVLFHTMGDTVRRFFATISFGYWNYRMDRTHSIMRIATTASPVSGSDVRQQMRRLRMLKKVNHSINVISSAYLSYKQRKQSLAKEEKEAAAPHHARSPSSQGINIMEEEDEQVGSVTANTNSNP